MSLKIKKYKEDSLSLKKLNTCMVVAAILISLVLFFAMSRTSSMYDEAHVVTEEIKNYETTAYNLSDESILQIDRMRDPQEMLRFLQTLCVRFTSMVHDSRTLQDAPAAVRKCLHLIETDLHGKLTAASLAKRCALSPDYLCVLFKKHVGMPLSAYIRSRRLYAARDLLLTDKPISEIAYDLGFCSESYFISCFKRQFGQTPRRAREQRDLLFPGGRLDFPGES